jgi:hypothetical protein
VNPIDLSKLPRVGGTPAGGYYELEPRIVLAVPNAGYRQTTEGARASLLEANRIARERGASHVTIVLVDRVESQDSGSRRVWTDEADPQLLRALGLVTESLLARAIGSFFMGLTRPRIPTAMFPNLEQAVVWARECLEGPQGG